MESDRIARGCVTDRLAATAFDAVAAPHLELLT